MIQCYIEYISPGSFVSETSSVKVPEKTLDYVKKGKYSFGFRFYDREEIQTEKELLTGKPKNYSHWFYWGDELTKKQVHKKYGKDAIISRNMDNNNIERVVETKFGQSIPLENEDIVI